MSETDNSVMRGVMLRMRTEDKKVRLAITLESGKAAHLTLNSRLPRLGHTVQPAKE